MIKWLRRRREQRREQREQAILRVLADGRRWYSLDLAQAAGLGVVPIFDHLCRLEAAGVVESGWYDGPPGYPRRRWYRLARSGEVTR